MTVCATELQGVCTIGSESTTGFDGVGTYCNGKTASGTYCNGQDGAKVLCDSNNDPVASSNPPVCT